MRLIRRPVRIVMSLVAFGVVLWYWLVPPYFSIRYALALLNAPSSQQEQSAYWCTYWRDEYTPRRPPLTCGDYQAAYWARAYWDLHWHRAPSRFIGGNVYWRSFWLLWAAIPDSCDDHDEAYWERAYWREWTEAGHPLPAVPLPYWRR